MKADWPNAAKTGWRRPHRSTASSAAARLFCAPRRDALPTVLYGKHHKAAEPQHHRQPAVDAGVQQQLGDLPQAAGQALPALQHGGVDGKGVGVVQCAGKEHQREADSTLVHSTCHSVLNQRRGTAGYARPKRAAVWLSAPQRPRSGAGQAPGQVTPVGAVPKAGAQEHDDDVEVMPPWRAAACRPARSKRNRGTSPSSRCATGARTRQNCGTQTAPGSFRSGHSPKYARRPAQYHSSRKNPCTAARQTARWRPPGWGRSWRRGRRRTSATYWARLSAMTIFLGSPTACGTRRPRSGCS